MLGRKCEGQALPVMGFLKKICRFIDMLIRQSVDSLQNFDCAACAVLKTGKA
jgi:hypothetical protein